MTAEERQALKVLIDGAARRRASHAVGEGLCWWCEAPLSGLQRKFCSANHRQYWWAKYTEAGARFVEVSGRRRCATRRAKRRREALAEALR